MIVQGPQLMMVQLPSAPTRSKEKILNARVNFSEKKFISTVNCL